MEFKWLSFILSVLIFSANAKAGQYPEEPTHRYNYPRKIYQNRYGYDTKNSRCIPPADPKVPTLCMEAESVIGCSSYTYIPDGLGGQVQFCKINSVTRSGVVSPVDSALNYTIATRFIDHTGKPSVVLPPNEVFSADKDKVIRQFITQRKSEGRVCTGDDCTPSLKQVLTDLAAPILDAFDGIQSEGPDVAPAPIRVLAPPKKFDDYFMAKARKTGDPEQSLRNYNLVKPYIMEAAAAFNIDPAMLFCLKNIESSESNAYSRQPNGQVKGPRFVEWHPSAVSSSGAVGLGQFLPGTAFDINASIYNNPALTSKYDAYLKKFNRTKPAQFRINDSSFYNQSQNNGSAYNRYARMRSKSGQASQVALSAVDISDKNSTTQCDDRCDPLLSAGLSAMYLRYIIDEYGNKYENKAMNFEYKVFIAGAYNRGPGAIAGAIEAGTGPLNWQNNFGKTHGAEVKGHMTKIRTCMQEITK